MGRLTDAQVLERDNYQCRICGVGGDNQLQIHHIVYRSMEKNEDGTNRITICWRCHDKIHTHAISLTVVIDEDNYPHIYIKGRNNL